MLNLTTRAVGTPRLLVVDSGVAAHPVGLSARRATHPEAPVGPLLENFVLGELARQLSWSAEPIRLHHYRDRDGYEVDAVLERASGRRPLAFGDRLRAWPLSSLWATPRP